MTAPSCLDVPPRTLHLVKDVNRLMRRSDYLDEDDRLLLRNILGNGLSIYEVARLRGVSRRSVQRQMRRLIARLSSQAVIDILRRCGRWEPLTRQVALAHWVRGYSLYRTGAELGLTLHQVRCQVEIVRSLLSHHRTPQARKFPAPLDELAHATGTEH